MINSYDVHSDYNENITIAYRTVSETTIECNEHLNKEYAYTRTQLIAYFTIKNNPNIYLIITDNDNVDALCEAFETSLYDFEYIYEDDDDDNEAINDYTYGNVLANWIVDKFINNSPYGTTIDVHTIN